MILKRIIQFRFDPPSIWTGEPTCSIRTWFYDVKKIEKRTGGRTDERTNGRTDEQSDGRTDDRTDERSDRRSDVRTDGRTVGRTDERPDGRSDEDTTKIRRRYDEDTTV